MSRPLTGNQVKLLRLCEKYGEFDGSLEIESQWGDYEQEDDPEGSKGFRVTRLVIESIARSLINRGLVTKSEHCSGWTVTEIGKSELAKLGNT